MSSPDYNAARKKGLRAVREAQLAGTYPYLPALDEILGKEGEMLSQVNLHLREIPTSMVAGTKTRGRQNSFACNYMPIMDAGTEFASKWDSVLEYQMDVGISDPIKCYEYLKRFYVQEGNKRVSVLKYMDVPSVYADVIRIMPAHVNDPEIETYYEFVEFYKVCPIYEIDFTWPGSYRRFADAFGGSMTEPWPSDTVRQVEAIYYRFENIFNAAKSSDLEGMKVGDALLVYFSFYTPASLLDQPRSVLEKRIVRLTDEFKSLMNQDHIALQKAPVEGSAKKDQGLFSFFFERPTIYTESRPLNVAFLYTWNPQESSWVSDMEIGRVYLEHRFEGLVKTSCYSGCEDDASIRNAITKAAEAGADVIVTTSPLMMPRSVRAALHYPKIRFLNMSLNLSHRSVRSYYARMYEAKFLLGAAAAIHCRNHKIGFLGDTPLYGNVSNINAFAIGAALIDPDVKIYLEWSSFKDHDWKKSFADQDVTVISGPDYAWFHSDPALHGLYSVSGDGSIVNLASPHFNWGRYYELIVKSILDGTYDDDPGVSENQAINYWYGYSAGVIDVVLSESNSCYTRKLISILKKGIISGSVVPFAGEINTQTGQLQPPGGPALDDDSIIRMDWLNENIIGRIPEKEEMTERAQRMLSVSGVREDFQKADKVEN